MLAVAKSWLLRFGDLVFLALLVFIAICLAGCAVPQAPVYVGSVTFVASDRGIGVSSDGDQDAAQETEPTLSVEPDRALVPREVTDVIPGVDAPVR